MTSLLAVRTALASCTSAHATTFTTLLDNGSLIPYKSRDNARRKYGLDTEYAALGKKQAPIGLRKPIPPNELQSICLRELPEAREDHGPGLIYTYFASPSGPIPLSSLDDSPSATQTIASLTDPTIAADTIVNFPSATLNDIATPGYEPPTNCTHVSGTECTILPANVCIPLHHSNEGMTTRTLLAGSLVWITWPSTPTNLRILQRAYESSTQTKQSDLAIACTLEGGMTFVQTPGDGLRIAPFSIMLCLSTQPSALATYSDVSVENFITAMHHIPLLTSFYRSEANGWAKQGVYNNIFLGYLDAMLNGDPDNKERKDLQLSGELLAKLVDMWDRAKMDLAGMLGPADYEAVVAIWGDFQSGNGRLCRFCGERVAGKKGMGMHWMEEHWVTLGVAERRRAEARGVEDDGVGGDGSDAMEVDG